MMDRGQAQKSAEPTTEEIDVLLHILLKMTQYDFKNYSRGMITRRIKRRMILDRYHSISELVEDIEKSPRARNLLISEFCIHVTEFFRDPNMYKSLREHVIPVLTDLPFVRIWIAGCASGEEAYSLAVILKEVGILSKSRIYATDIKSSILEEARRGRFSAQKLPLYTKNYENSGGRGELTDFGEISEGYFYFDSELMNHITFSQHNVTTDELFQEFDMILCRNVMIYFDRFLTNTVHQHFYNCLKSGGYLILGDKETIRFTGFEKYYSKVENRQKVYQKLFIERGWNNG